MSLPDDASQVHAVRIEGLWFMSIKTEQRTQYAGFGPTLQNAFDSALSATAQDIKPGVALVPKT